MPKLSILIPTYFNEKNIAGTTKRLIDNEKLFPSDVTFEYVMVDDASGDETYRELLHFQKQYSEKVKIIGLARNFGSFNALLAAMKYSSGDCCAIIAADLQDPPELIPKMYRYWQEGIKLVIANRAEREDGYWQNLLSKIYHYMIRKFALKNVPAGGFDFVLFDKQLKEQILKMDESNTNIFYLLTWLGYDYVNIPYTRIAREVGVSQWTYAKKIKMFVDSFVSFSFFPIRMITVGGIAIGIIALLYAFLIIFAKSTHLIELEGWSTMMVVFLFISSFQTISIGILGEYLWRSLDASRKRPNFIVDTVVDHTN